MKVGQIKRKALIERPASYAGHSTIIPTPDEELDQMPSQVATEMLCEPLTRLNAPTRRSAIRARWRYFRSQQSPKPADEKLLAKLAGATLAQLGKWLKRAATRRLDCQRAFLRVTGTTPLHDRLRAALEVKAAQCDIMRDACESEIERRQAEIKRRQDLRHARQTIIDHSPSHP